MLCWNVRELGTCLPILAPGLGTHHVAQTFTAELSSVLGTRDPEAHHLLWSQQHDG